MTKRRGRPKKDKYNINNMAESIDSYVQKENIPILKEVCFLNDWCYDYVMQLQRKHENLSQSIKKLLLKKESQLEKLALFCRIDHTMAIFSLKQLGWKEKQEIQLAGEINNPMEGLTTEELRELIKINKKGGMRE